MQQDHDLFKTSIREKIRAATQRQEAKVLDRDHHQWVRRSLWRTAECTGWLAWNHLQHVWLVRTGKFARQTTPRADTMPGEIEDHSDITNVPWQRGGGGEPPWGGVEPLGD